MASAGKSQLLSFMDDLIPTIRTALCDRFVYFILNRLLLNLLICYHVTIHQYVFSALLRSVNQQV